MQSPIVAFLGWYQTLPAEHKQDIAETVVLHNPGYDGIDFRQADLIECFAARLSACAEAPFLNIGMCLSLRASVEFHFMRTRGSEASWDHHAESLLEGKHDFLEEGSETGVVVMDRALRGLPEKMEQWLATADSWRRLVEEQLSDEYIAEWQRFRAFRSRG